MGEVEISREEMWGEWSQNEKKDPGGPRRLQTVRLHFLSAGSLRDPSFLVDSGFQGFCIIKLFSKF